MTARIVVGVDGSDHADRALRFALEEAARRGDAVVEAVHSYHAVVYMPGMEFGYVMPPTREELETEAKRRLDHALRDVPDGIKVEPIVVPDSASHALLEAGKGADLLVVGTRGHGGFRGLLLGSTSMQVVTHATCPVVVVPGAREDD